MSKDIKDIIDVEILSKIHEAELKLDSSIAGRHLKAKILDLISTRNYQELHTELEKSPEARLYVENCCLRKAVFLNKQWEEAFFLLITLEKPSMELKELAPFDELAPFKDKLLNIEILKTMPIEYLQDVLAGRNIMGRIASHGKSSFSSSLFSEDALADIKKVASSKNKVMDSKISVKTINPKENLINKIEPLSTIKSEIKAKLVIPVSQQPITLLNSFSRIESAARRIIDQQIIKIAQYTKQLETEDDRHLVSMQAILDYYENANIVKLEDKFQLILKRINLLPKDSDEHQTKARSLIDDLKKKIDRYFEISTSSTTTSPSATYST